MAKTPRHMKAWNIFKNEFIGAGYFRKGYCAKGKSRRANNHEKQYRKLIKLADDFGISVFKKDCLGISKDATGKEFFIGGLWRANNLKHPKIEIVSRSVSTVAHELAHAMDQLKRSEFSSRREQELIACSVGYLITCELLGIQNPKPNTEYAKSQGATKGLLLKMEAEIFDLFYDIMELFQKTAIGGGTV